MKTISPTNNFQQAYFKYIKQKRRAGIGQFIMIVFGLFLTLLMVVVFLFFDDLIFGSSSSSSYGDDIFSISFGLIEGVFEFFAMMASLVLLLGALMVISLIGVVFVAIVGGISMSRKKVVLVAPLPADFMQNLHFLIEMEIYRTRFDGDTVKNGMMMLLNEHIKSSDEAHAVILDYRNLYQQDLISELEDLSKNEMVKRKVLGVFIKYGVCHPQLYYYLKKEN
jgi:hypothetical protein